MTWDSLKISSILPAELTAASKTLTQLIDSYVELSKIADTALQTASRLEIGVDVSPIKALLKSLSEALASLVNAGKIHVLFVPIAKPVTITSTLSINSAIDNDTLLSAENKRLFSSVLNGTNLGNKGFYKLFVESLSDTGDINRPRFVNTDHIGCHVLMTGEASLTRILSSAAVLDRILDAKRATLTNRIIKTPQGLTAKVIAAPNNSNTGIRLDWKAAEKDFSPRYYPIVFNQTRTAIIRSTSSSILSAHCVTDIFASPIKKGLKNAEGTAEVIDIITPALTGYVDTVNLTKGSTYYYAIAWETEASETLSVTNLGFDKISTIVKVSYKDTVPTQVSKYPDWQSYGSAVDLFPQLSLGLRLISEELDILSNTNDGVKSAIKTQISLLNDSVDVYAKKADLISNQLERLTATLSATVGVYHTSFKGVGGNNFIASQLYDALFNASDTTRPPFDGSQYTIGVVILYGAGREVDITPIHDLLNLLLGNNGATNPALTALQSIDVVIGAQEAALFNQQLKTVSPTTTTDHLTGTITPTVDSTTGLPPVPHVSTVIATNATAVASDSPDNPLLNETGEVTIKC